MTTAKEEPEKETALQRGREFVEGGIENLLFASRWTLAPIYLGLVVALGVVVVVFVKKLVDFITEGVGIGGHPIMSAEAMSIGILSLLDVALIGNLLLLVIFSGYENFVSKIGAAEDHEDRPPWMGHLDFSGLKMKIVGSIVAISLIELLQIFLHVGTEESHYTNSEIAWRIGLHLTFVVSGLLFAIMDYWGEKRVAQERENIASSNHH